MNATTILSWLTAVGEWLEDHDGAITAVSTVFIAIFTIALALYTKRLGKMALKQDARMRESIRVSKNAMRLSEAAMVAGERAFVFATGLEQYWEHVAVTNSYNWRFRPTWRNSGDTPTKNLTIHAECDLRDSRLPDGFNFNYETTNIGKGLLPPRLQLSGGIVPRAPAPALTPQDIVEIQGGTKFFYVWGWAKYNDVFPNTPQRITRFCWVVLPNGNPLTFKPQSTNLAEQLHFPYLYHHEGNCADGECE